jgi:hypothetical protein
MELFVGSTDYFNLYDMSKESGLYIFIGNNSIKLLDNEAIQIPSNMHTDIGVERLFIRKMPTPFSACIDNFNSSAYQTSKIYKEMSKSKFKYRQIDCFQLSIQDYIINKCKCSIQKYDNLYNEVQCNETMAEDCGLPTEQEYFKLNKKKDYSEMCPLECDSINYSYTLSTSQYPTLSYTKILRKSPAILSKFGNQTLSDSELAQGVISLAVFYSKLEYSELVETASLSEISLIAGLGGTLGLFLGVSVLTFIEVFEYLLRILTLNRSMVGQSVQ